VEFLVDQSGQPILAWDVTTAAAVWEHGFIHVSDLGWVIVVSLCPALVNDVMLAGAIDEIARLEPLLVLLRSDREIKRVEAYRRPATVFYRMWDLVAAAGNVPAYPRVPLEA
jgi:hypothetical protein